MREYDALSTFACMSRPDSLDLVENSLASWMLFGFPDRLDFRRQILARVSSGRV